MLAGRDINGDLTEVGKLRVEVANLRRQLADAHALRASYFALAETRLEWAVKLQDKINALRVRISDLADQEGR